MIDQRNFSNKGMSYTLVTNLIDKQVKKNPDAVAVVDGEYAFTYRSLKEFSNRYASALLEENVRKGDVVAIIGDSSFLKFLEF